jgi:hypothetical protein
MFSFAIQIGKTSFVVRLGMRSGRLSAHDEAGGTMWLVQGDTLAAVQRQYFAQHVFPDPISQARVSFFSTLLPYPSPSMSV